MNVASSRYRGALLGLAIGDALGAPVEFLERDTFAPIEGYKSGGKFNLTLGEYTDDTAMALCLAQSLISCNGFNSKDQLERYLRWFREGYMSATGRSIGCGKTILRALMRYQTKGCTECGNSRLKKGAGNGSLMRVAPVALFYAADIKKAMEMAHQSSTTTHGLKICADACRLFVGVLVGALEGIEKEELLSHDNLSYLCGLDSSYCYDPLVLQVMQGSYKTKPRDAISSSGYVINTLEAALWAFYHTDNFNDGVRLAVNLGKDADTVGAVYGQLAGAYYGVEGIENRYIDGLMGREWIEEMADRLFENSAV